MSVDLMVCIVGCGKVAPFHAAGYAELGGGIRLVFCDSSEDRARELADRFGGEHFTDYSAAIERADIVDICTPHHLHATMACEALAAGKHVLVEKPMARTLGEADEMLASAEKAGTRFMLCENLAFHRHVTEIDRAVSAGDIGEPFLIEMSYLDLWSGLRADRGWRSRHEKMGGGILIENGSHYVYLIRRWCRDLESVFARMSRATFGRQGEDTAVVVAGDRSGLTATLHISWGAPGGLGLPAIAVYGTEGALYSTDDGLLLGTADDSREKPKRRKLCDGAVMPLWWEAVGTGVRAFLECVQRDTEPPVPGRVGRDVQEIIEAAARSAEEGIVVGIGVR